MRRGGDWWPGGDDSKPGPLGLTVLGVLVAGSILLGAGAPAHAAEMFGPELVANGGAEAATPVPTGTDMQVLARSGNFAGYGDWSWHTRTTYATTAVTFPVPDLVAGKTYRVVGIVYRASATPAKVRLVSREGLGSSTIAEATIPNGAGHQFATFDAVPTANTDTKVSLELVNGAAGIDLYWDGISVREVLPDEPDPEPTDPPTEPEPTDPPTEPETTNRDPYFDWLESQSGFFASAFLAGLLTGLVARLTKGRG
jgi:hypothetical protein